MRLYGFGVISIVILEVKRLKQREVRSLEGHMITSEAQPSLSEQAGAQGQTPSAVSGERPPAVWREVSGAGVSCSVMSHSFCPALRLLCPWDSPGKNTGVGCHFLLQGIFLTQGLNPGLLHCRQILHCLSHQGSPLSGAGDGQNQTQGKTS